MENPVREEIKQAFLALVLGPQASDETLTSNPSDTYLTGILWPRGATLSGEGDDAANTELASDEAVGLDQAIPGYRAIKPCSVGLTCSIWADATIEIDFVDTARYAPITRVAPVLPAVPATRKKTGKVDVSITGSVTVASNEATPEVVPVARELWDWKRTPLGYRLVIPPVETRSSWRAEEFIGPNGSPVCDSRAAIDIKRRVSEGQIALTVTLINTAPELETNRDAAFLFQAGIRIRAVRPDGRQAIVPRPATQRADDDDALTNLLLYRHVREYAVGHGIAAHWPQPTGDCVDWVGTTWIPETQVKGMSPKGHANLKPLQKEKPGLFSADWLAREPARREVCNALDEFCKVYEGWIRRELYGAIGGFSSDLLKAAEGNLARCDETLVRMIRGVKTLRSTDDAWAAFAKANEAMDQQSRFASKGDKAGPLVWRPFQLAFMLMVLPSIADARDPDRDTMDLLWFPTGGGKTEAYLALTAFAIFISRLRSVARRDAGGVEVIMRYTLRLLTVQQFQRATALITACDAIRSTDERRFGKARISIGLYVGGDSTPNTIEEAESRLEDERQGGRPTSTPRQLLQCPVCGGALGTSAYSLFPADSRMEIVCVAKECGTAGKTLPVMTVDEAIYAHPPSLVIGTVDKFAQLPRRTDIRQLFGLDGSERPGLIIQDELHLISGPLGSMAGLYEAAIDMLCTRDGVRPKLIGSTATIGRAASQVLALFDRSVLQFPPPGFDAADSFFAVRDLDEADRLYLGIASAGRSPKFALQAVLAALLQSPHALHESGRATDAQADPYWTCVAYFNSLRELGGAHVLMLDDVPRQLQFLSRRLGSSPRRLEGPPVELSSRVPSNKIPEVLLQLGRKLGDPDPFAPPPTYAVLASNMISVGVDIPRLGLMAVNGQPKSTAEYIQATSRVGRGIPGLVVTLYNFGRPRDVSHFEHFLNYHGALYRSVEATSVTPWAPRARDKALHAVLIAAVRHLVAGMVNDEDAVRFDGHSPEVARIVDRLQARAMSGSYSLEGAATRADLAEIVGVWARRSEQSRTMNQRLRYWEKRAPFGRTAPHLMRSAEEPRSAGSAAWATPNSMRDVEPSTAFILKNPGSKRRIDNGNPQE